MMFALTKHVIGKESGIRRRIAVASPFDIPEKAKQNIMMLLGVAGSLKYDNSWADDRVWTPLLEMFGFEPVSLNVFTRVLAKEYDEPRHELTGNYRNIEWVVDELQPAEIASLGADGAGDFAIV